MAYYITYGELQRHLKEYAERTGRRMQFPEMTDYLYRKGILSDTRPKDIPVHKMFREMSDEEFEKIMDAMILTLTPNLQMSPHVTELSFRWNGTFSLSGIQDIRALYLTIIIILRSILLPPAAAHFILKGNPGSSAKGNSAFWLRAPNIV